MAKALGRQVDFCYPMHRGCHDRAAAAPQLKPRQYLPAVSAVSLAINSRLFGDAERDAVQRAYAVREVWAGMLLADRVLEHKGAVRGPPLAALAASLHQPVLAQGGVVWPGSALRSAHSPPPGILTVAFVLSSFRRAPPSQGFFCSRGARGP